MPLKGQCSADNVSVLTVSITVGIAPKPKNLTRSESLPSRSVR